MAEKAQKMCYERRAACIIKKSKELGILCGLKIGVVILGPDGKLESWPPELNEVKVLLEAGKERTRVKNEKRKGDNPETCHREILVSKLQLLNQRVEFFKGKETVVRSKKRKDEFGDNSAPPASAYAEGKEIELFDDLDFFFKFVEEEHKNPQNNGANNSATLKAKEIATMDSGTLQAACGVRFEACYPLQNSFTALPPTATATATAAEECGEVEVRKKARLQYPTAALNNNLPLFTPPPAAEYWESMFTNSGLLDSTDAMLSLLQDL